MHTVVALWVCRGVVRRSGYAGHAAEARSRHTAGGRQRPRDASGAAVQAVELADRASHLGLSECAADLQDVVARADARGLENAAWRGVRTR